MVNPQLINYIRDYLNKGYSVVQIREHLIQSGYPQFDVDSTINYVLGTRQAHPALASSSTDPAQQLTSRTALSPGLILIVIVFVFGIALAGYIVYSIVLPSESPTSAASIGFRTEVLTSKVMPKATFKFVEMLTNLGKPASYEIDVRHEVVDSTGKTLTSHQEIVPLTTAVSKRVSIHIPDGASTGTYTLRSIAKFDGVQKDASLDFSIFSPSAAPSCNDKVQNQAERGVDCGGPCLACPTCWDDMHNQDELGVDCGGTCAKPCAPDICPSGCDDGNVCTADSCVYGRCVNSMKVPCCGNEVCEDNEDYASCQTDCQVDGVPIRKPSEIIEDISLIGRKDPKTAAKDCDSIQDVTPRDDCFEMLVKVSKNALFCDYIEKDNSRNTCYSSFAQDTNDYTLCEKITNSIQKDSCIALGRARASMIELRAMQVQTKTSAR